MKRPLRFTRQAEADLDRLIDFLDAVAPRAAIQAATLIREKTLLLLDFPEAGAPFPSGRELLIWFGDSGYVVRYRVDPDVVIIARIFHMRETR